jgi:pyruvate/2-oxoglutarate dehydrogenase complex dihydrolipoamide dehydrogenase (E3) component
VSDVYDLVVLGGGTGGLVSALIAAGVGARVALIERDRTGGDCLWTGCVPSKSLIAAASLAHRMRHADAVGLKPTDPEIDFARVMGHVHSAIKTLEPEDSPERLRGAGVDVIHATGRFTAPGRMQADGSEVRFRSAIIATGSSPLVPPIPGLEAAGPLTTDAVWELRELPRRLAVLGGGPVGCELAQAFARLGSRVTLVEMAERLLLKEEPRASELIASRLLGDGIDVRIGKRASEVRRVGADHELVIEDSDDRIAFDTIIVATGRAPRTDGLGLDTVGVELGRSGAITVDRHLRTSARGIFAVGDVTGLLPFTHVAAHHARVATPNALFKTRGTVSETLPWVTFTDPEVGRVGLTEAQARERWGERVKLAEFEYAELDRAITAGEADGFAKLIGDPRGRLVGATVAAPSGGEAIAELTAWVSAGAKIDAVSRTVHAYPTLAEGPARAADQYLASRYSSPRVRALTGRILTAVRLLDRRR